nr:thermosome subunit [Thermoproteota archaeon]
DPLDTQVQLRSKSNTGKARYGIDVINGRVADLAAKDIYEPLAVKEQVLNAATEAACMILRIDDVIAASKPKDVPKPGGYGGPGGGMGGGGMEDMDM